MATYIKTLKDGNNDTLLPRTRVGAITLDDGTTELADIINVVLVYNGIKATYANLPSSGQKIGDMYYVTADSVHYFWNGTAWAIVGGGSGVASDIEFTPTGGIAATNVQTAIAELDTEKAKLASPTFTGTPKAPTAAAGTDTTQLATTAFVQQEIDANAYVLPLADSSTVGGARLKNYLTSTDSGAALTAAQGKILKDLVDSKAPLSSPTFTGAPAAPTAAAGTNTTQIATTAFVTTAIGSAGGGLPVANDSPISLSGIWGGTQAQYDAIDSGDVVSTQIYLII